MFNTVLWRMRDAERNSISMLAYSEFSHKSLQNKNSEDKKKMLLGKGIDWELLEDGLKYGFYFKKMVFEKTPNVLRRKILCKSKKFFFSEENVELIFSKEIGE